MINEISACMVRDLTALPFTQEGVNKITIQILLLGGKGATTLRVLLSHTLRYGLGSCAQDAALRTLGSELIGYGKANPKDHFEVMEIRDLIIRMHKSLPE